MSIKQLQKRWNIDKDFFAQKEIGELQDFVKDILQESDIFALKKGIGSTPNKKRKYEFTIETSKEGRRADFVIFIKGEDVVIPVEVEKHNNIKKGIEQVFQYQKDWNKKYAILTDGNEWRFYRSNKFKTFFIENILDNPKDFLVYWHEYIKSENYYIELFNQNNQEVTEKLELNQPENRLLFFDDITQVIYNFKGKMKAIGAFDDLFKIKEYDKIAVETSYAYLIQFILYKVLVDNGYKKFKDEYDNTLNKIQKALFDKDFYSIIINEIKNISEYISQYIYKPFSEEQKNINTKLIDNLRGNLSIDDIAPWLDIMLFINRYNFAGLSNEIFGFVYENYLKDLYEEKNKGQYFTDSAVVNFMLKEIGYTEKEISKSALNQKISIIDPSCGAGTFLYSAADKIINTFDDGSEKQSKYIEDIIDKNIFGLDIEEFPLYLAEMNILMRLLPLIVNDRYENPIDNKLKIFKTKDSISEFLDTGINSKVEEEINLFNHLEKTALDYPSFMRDEKDLEAMLKSLQEKSGVRERFDFVIGNPPYISYNMCCKQKVDYTIKIKDKNDPFTMGNVYGMNLNTVPGRIKTYPPKPNLYAFFIALGLGLLKDNGKLCYIIPQTILSANDLDVLRYHLSKFTIIEKLITFHGNMFIGRGLKQNRPVPTSSLIFVLKKHNPKQNHKVEITNYTSYNDKNGIDFEKYIKSREKITFEILQSELLENVDNWNFLTYSPELVNFAQKYKELSDSFDIYRLFENSVPRFKDKFYFDVGFILDKKFITSEKKEGYYSILDFKNFSGYSKFHATQYYPNDNDKIELTRSNQGHVTLSPKYSIVWRIKNPEKFHLTSERIIFNMGTSSIITSNNYSEMLYVFSLLNSFVSKKILEFYLKIASEKEYIVAILPIKKYIRVPKINNENISIKEEVIKQTEKLLNLENNQIKDFVEFNTSKQKFDSVKIENKYLILTDKDEEIKLRIKSNVDMVEKIINDTFNSKRPSELTLHNLKFIEAIDIEQQNSIKDYIDDLIFALYFNIPIPNISITNAEQIKKLCNKNNFYNSIKQ